MCFVLMLSFLSSIAIAFGIATVLAVVFYFAFKSKRAELERESMTQTGRAGH